MRSCGRPLVGLRSKQTRARVCAYVRMCVCVCALHHILFSFSDRARQRGRTVCQEVEEKRWPVDVMGARTATTRWLLAETCKLDDKIRELGVTALTPIDKQLIEGCVGAIVAVAGWPVRSVCARAREREKERRERKREERE